MWFQSYPTFSDFERVDKISFFGVKVVVKCFLAFETLGYYADMYNVHPGSIMMRIECVQA
jgi:hypothetical protein